jgi:hypothetical protein
MPPSPDHTVLLQERPVVEDGPFPSRAAEEPWRAVAATTPARRRAGVVSEVVGSPGLALLASLSFLEAYRWFGVIAGGGSRPWAVVFAAVSLPMAAALTRRPDERRSVTDRLVVFAAATGAVVTALALALGGPWASDAIGIPDLALGAAALGALAVGERRRHRGDGAP